MGKYIELSNDLNERNLKIINLCSLRPVAYLQYSLNVSIVNAVSMVATETAS